MENPIKRSVVRMLRELPKQTLPFDLFSVTKYYDNIAIVPFSKMMNLYDLSFSDVVNYLSSTDACTIYSPAKDRYIIYYNDLDTHFITSNRYRFSIAHELGHIFLNHLHNNGTAIEQGIISNFEYRKLEREADKFASYLLCPFSSFKERSISTKDRIKRFCEVSSAAAEIAYSDFRIWLSRRGVKSIHELKYLHIQDDDYDDWINSKFSFSDPKHIGKHSLFLLSSEEFNQLEEEHFNHLFDKYGS